MALKYWFEFTDVKEITHRVEISNEDFDGDSIQIYGSCSLEYSETKDTLEPIRGSGLKIDLEADSDLTFYDLYSEEERTFSVVYRRDNEILFNGWLSPEGIYESLVSDKWVISLDCTDGLGFLKNLSYVEDATGLNFVGKQSLIKIVSNCLKRTKIQSKIYAGIEIYYTGLSDNLSILENVYYNADRFVKEDSNPVSGSDGTIMNCEEVLKSVLEPFGAVITAYKGEWLIYKPNSLVNNNIIPSFFGYDYNGDALTSTTKSFDFRTNLGSQINGFYPHHVNANQQKTIKSSIGAFRINYKYGLVKSLIENKNLESISDTNIPGYNIIDNTYLDFPTDRKGVLIDSESSIFDVLELQAPLNIDQNNFLSFYFAYFTDVLSSFVRISVKLVGSLNTYYLKMEGQTSETNSNSAPFGVNRTFNASWSTGVEYIEGFSSVQLTNQEQTSSVRLNSQETPEDGDLQITIHTGGNKFFTPSGNAEIKEIQIFLGGNDPNLKGENHTFQRELKPSSKIKDVKKVFNGDNDSDIYVGTIYKADQINTTESWTRYGASEAKSILQIMGEERMKMYSKPLQVYSGDVFGFFNYLNVATISGFTGVYMPTSYSYDCQSNITSIKYVEILDTDILDDIDYQKTLDYGNVVEPTIRG